jgi:hypothetical protein
MTTVSVAKREGLSPFFQRSFDDPGAALRFAFDWTGSAHVTIGHAGQALSPNDFRTVVAGAGRDSALRPFQDASGADTLCPFCGATETPILADDECLHACATCDRAWYIDDDGNVLPADRCPTCESPDIAVDDDSDARTCGACGHRFFFDGLTYVDPATVATESDGAEC